MRTRNRWVPHLDTIEPANNPIRNDVRGYLILQMLKDDPKFRDRKFTQGDTVRERYSAMTPEDRFFGNCSRDASSEEVLPNWCHFEALTGQDRVNHDTMTPDDGFSVNFLL